MRLRLLTCVAAIALCAPQSPAQTAAVAAWQAPYNSYTGYNAQMPGTSPAVANMLVDDWLGFGYMRYSSPRYTAAAYSRSPYSNSVYAPHYPGVMNYRCPLLLPFVPIYSLIHAHKSYMRNAWHGGMPYNGYPYASRCSPQWYPRAPCAPMNCCPQPCCPPAPVCPPVAVRVPVTTCRPVTVDAGYYRQVWVSRPRTVMVPETRWRTQYVQPGNAWRQQPPVWNQGCQGPGCTPAAPQQFTPAAAAPAPTLSGTNMAPGGGVPTPQAYWTPSQQAVTSPAATAFSGDVYGDHETTSVQRTAVNPVIPNAFRGTTPVVQTSFVNRYPVTQQPQRRYSSSIR